MAQAVGWFTIILCFIAAISVTNINRHQDEELRSAMEKQTQESLAIRVDIKRMRQQVEADHKEIKLMCRIYSGWGSLTMEGKKGE